MSNFCLQFVLPPPATASIVIVAGRPHDLPNNPLNTIMARPSRQCQTYQQAPYNMSDVLATGKHPSQGARSHSTVREPSR